LTVSEKSINKDSHNHFNNKIKAKVQENYNELPLYFIQNNGQIDASVEFYGKQKEQITLFTKRGIYLVACQTAKDSKQERTEPYSVNHLPKVQRAASHQDSESGLFIPQSEIFHSQSSIIKLLPLNANKELRIIAEDRVEGKVNYLIGNDPKKWKTDIPKYKTVVYKEVYKDVDIKFYGNNQQMEYDIIIKPGGDPSRVKFAYRGIKGLNITDEGNLETYLKDGLILQKRPYIYQEILGERVEIKGEFVIHDHKLQSVKVPENMDADHGHRFIYGFRIGSYDKEYPLIIDPILVYSTYLGGNGSEWGRGIVVDTLGNAYITGETWSNNFPTISALYKNKTGDARSPDIFITKINASGTIIYSTYLGGSNDDISNGIAVDSSGNVYVTGHTHSADFPLSSAIYNKKKGESDAFVVKLNTSGDALVYSTYLGGSGPDRARGIAVDTKGNAYITGWTYSLDFPTISAVFGKKSAGFHDAFITKINASGSKLVYSMYLGGSNYDVGNGIAVDNYGNSYVTGYTNSTDFPTASAMYPTYAGGYHDAFITKINASGSKLIYSTYLGGNHDDVGYDIAVDTPGNAYITGMTWSNNFPVVSPVQKNIAGNNDAFITKLDTKGSIAYSTYLGGSTYDGGYGIAVDLFGNAYITGVTRSDDFPITQGNYGKPAGDNDAFVTKMNASGSKLAYSLYLGGDNDDIGYGIDVDTSGNAYVTGSTWSDNFPVISATYESKAQDYDVFITKISPMRAKISGYITDMKDNPIASVSLLLKGTKMTSRSLFSDENGFFTFDDLDADTYSISAEKTGYKETKQKVEIDENITEIITIKLTTD
jgi:hypothetical protein